MGKSEEKEDSFWGKYKYLIIAFLLSIIVIVLWYNSYIWFFDNSATISEKGAYGDSFGLINSLFSGLAFIGIIVTIWMQSAELKLQREELRDTREVFEKQEKVMSNQLIIQEKQLRLQQSQIDLQSKQYSLQSQELDRLRTSERYRNKPALFFKRNGRFRNESGFEANLAFYSTYEKLRILDVSILGKHKGMIKIAKNFNYNSWLLHQDNPRRDINDVDRAFLIQLSNSCGQENVDTLVFFISVLVQDSSGLYYIGNIKPIPPKGFYYSKSYDDIDINEESVLSDFIQLTEVGNQVGYIAELKKREDRFNEEYD